jgi:hypothetical protein
MHSKGAVMATDQTGNIDPRFPEAYQRGGAGSAPVLDEAVAVRGASRPSASALAAGRASRSSRSGAVTESPARSGAHSSDPQPGSQHSGQRDSQVSDTSDHVVDEQHFELMVAGNPWLRALWVVGAMATIAGFALTVYAEFAFSVPPVSGIYDPSVYIVPRIAEAVAQPLVIAGVIALVAATALRIVAWRPSRVTGVIAER